MIDLAPQYIAFQSLIGFKINWNALCDWPRRGVERFQSLIGFKINWNDSIIDSLLMGLSFNP